LTMWESDYMYERLAISITECNKIWEEMKK